jgi:hypothetical protein
VSKRSLLAGFAGVVLALAGYLSATATSADPPTTTTAPTTTAPPPPPATTTAPTTTAPPPATTTAPPPATTTTATTAPTTTTTIAPATTAAATTTTVTTATPRAPKPPPPPQLSVSRAVTPVDGVTVGSTLSYTVSLRNTSKTGTGASVVDALSDTVALVGADADQGGSCSSAGAQVTCAWEAVNPNITVRAVIVVQVIRAGGVTNSVEPKAADPTTGFDFGLDFASVTAGQGTALRFTLD